MRTWSRPVTLLTIVALLLGFAIQLQTGAAASYSAQWVWQNAYPTLERNQCYRFVVQFRNSGTATWYPDIVHLGTDRPQDRIPGFIREDRCTGQTSGWISGNRVALQESSVPPGGIGSFAFWYTVTPDHAFGVFREYFRPVADGITWMEDWGVYWDVAVVQGATVTQRDAVIREAFYALSPSASGLSSRTITTSQGIMVAGDWNYLWSDQAALSAMLAKYEQANSSVWRRYPYPYQYRATSTPNIGYSPLWGGRSEYGAYGGYGRGGQCKFFANLVLYRSSGYRLQLPTYSTMQYYTRSVGYARPGDVIFRYGSNLTPHVAIVTKILSGDPNSGTVTSVDVVDANWCNRCEIIQRHPISGSTLTQFRVYTGADQGWNW